MKILVLIGTRPEIIKLSETIKKINKHFELILVHSGQNYDFELNQIFFEQLGIIKPKYFLNVNGGNASQTIGNIIIKFDEVLDFENPDAVLVYGDTNTVLGCIAAKKRKIPIFHMEAGNRSFDLRVPEEINRKIIDHISDINLVITEHSRRYLLNEGIDADSIIKIGSSMPEVLHFHRENIVNSDVLKELNILEKDYILVSLHREENVDNPLKLGKLVENIQYLNKYFDKRIIISTHPRTRKQLEKLNIEYNTDIQYMKPFGFHEYIKLQLSAFVVVSDSGTISEECSILNFPAISIRDSIERPEIFDTANLVICSVSSNRWIESIEILIKQLNDGFKPNTPDDYLPEIVSDKVVRIILSKTEQINRMVWRKNEKIQ
jgi:UDP-N-acetylglucosamine 2-epimerase (non-hydrolysing)